MESEKYLEDKVINNLIVARKHILAFQHEATSYALINRDGKNVQHMNWPCEMKTVVIGASMAPDFNADELSFVYIRDETTIKLLNTQTWLVSELVEVGEGLSYPDLQLFEVI